jgi:hypothetical protein
MATLENRYTINGLVDTSRTALDRMTDVTNSCNTWLSYDALVGKWSVVINRAGDAQYAFDDSNIIGPVNLSTTELTGYYNSCEVRFHNIELRDREDFVLLEIPADQRLPNEPDNRLIVNAPLVNNQIQAELIGLIELKQSRLDQVIEFVTDFSYVNIEAGSIITVTNSVYGWTNKLFRVLTMTEQQTEDAIAIQITAQAYDAAIYSDEDLYLYLRETEDGLIELDPLVDVSPVTDSTQVVGDDGSISPLLLALPLLLGLLDGFFDGDSSRSMIDIVSTSNEIEVSVGTTSTDLNAMYGGELASDGYPVYDPAVVESNFISIPFTLDNAVQRLNITVQSPTLLFDYYAKDSAGGTIRLYSNQVAQPPCQIDVFLGSVSPLNLLQTATIDWQQNNTNFIIDGAGAGNYIVTVRITPTYALNMFWDRSAAGIGASNVIFPINFDMSGSTNGFKVYVATTG